MSFVIPSFSSGSSFLTTESCEDTVSDLINATYVHLSGPAGEKVDLLDAGVNASTSSLVLTDGIGGVGPGRIIEIDDELMYARSYVDSTKTLTVIRGYRGTTAASHSSDAIVTIAPRFPRAFVRNALRDEIKSWPKNIYAVDTADVTVTDARGYDLPIGDYISILGAYLSPYDTTTEAWTSLSASSYDVRRAQVTSDFASGVSLTIPLSYTPARTVRVVYARKFDVSSMDDDVAVATTIGVPCSAMDIPPLGAAWRLTRGREVRRTDLQAQQQSRSAEQVPGGLSSAVSSGFKSDRDSRLKDEQLNLLRTYGIRF